jgi:hypothetical protein
MAVRQAFRAIRRPGLPGLAFRRTAFRGFHGVVSFEWHGRIHRLKQLPVRILTVDQFMSLPVLAQPGNCLLAITILAFRAGMMRAMRRRAPGTRGVK